MGRHKAMSALAPQTAAPTAPSPVAAASGHRRLPVEKLSPDQLERFEALRFLTIRVPAGPLRDAAVEAAARVWSATDVRSDTTDVRAVRILARYLHHEAAVFGYVDEERACTRAEVNRYLDGLADPTSATGNGHPAKTSTLRTVRWALFAAGRVLYPREYPAPGAPHAPRTAGTPAAHQGSATELYALAPSLPTRLGARLTLALDLVTGAGAQPAELREITGSDITAGPVTPTGELSAVVELRGRGLVRRTVPVVHPARLLARADQVGPGGTVMPVNRRGVVSANILNRISADLIRHGYTGVDFGALRARWILDLAADPHVPAAALLRLTGMRDLRVLADRADQLPVYTVDDLADMLCGSGEVAA